MIYIQLLLAVLVGASGWIVKGQYEIMATFQDIKDGLAKLATDVEEKLPAAGTVPVLQSDIDGAAQAITDLDAKVTAS